MSENFMRNTGKLVVMVAILLVVNRNKIANAWEHFFDDDHQTEYSYNISNLSGSGYGGSSNPSFGRKADYNYDSSAHCPTPSGSTTFVGIDKHNNGKIASTDKCINCDKMYFVHRK